MPELKPSAHLRRAKLAKRAQLVFGLITAGAIVYRLVSVLLGKSPLAP